jgi:hypothetical protein
MVDWSIILFQAHTIDFGKVQFLASNWQNHPQCLTYHMGLFIGQLTIVVASSLTGRKQEEGLTEGLPAKQKSPFCNWMLEQHPIPFDL